MEVLTFVLLGVAILLAIMNGANDGSALVANAMRVPSIHPLIACLLIAVAVAAVPLVAGIGVARTLSEKLVSFTGPQGSAMMLTTVGTTVLLVMWFSRVGIPTSLTLALIGSIVGVGIGAGIEVAWPVVGFVLLMGICSPIVGAVLGWLVTRTMSRLHFRRHSAPIIAHAHRVAFGAQSVAYAINDGQKSIAVFSVALVGLGWELVWWHLLGLGGLFLIGTLLGLKRMSKTIGNGFMAVRPWHAVSAELATTSAVIGSTLLAAPVSMTQTMASALVGSGASEGLHRIRWRSVMNLAIAWLVTLPAAAVVAGIAAAVITWSTA